MTLHEHSQKKQGTDKLAEKLAALTVRLVANARLMIYGGKTHVFSHMTIFSFYEVCYVGFLSTLNYMLLIKHQYIQRNCSMDKIIVLFSLRNSYLRQKQPVFCFLFFNSVLGREVLPMHVPNTRLSRASCTLAGRERLCAGVRKVPTNDNIGDPLQCARCQICFRTDLVFSRGRVFPYKLYTP